MPYGTVRQTLATERVGGVWDGNISGLFLFVLDVAHAPRAINEAFDPRAVG